MLLAIDDRTDDVRIELFGKVFDLRLFESEHRFELARRDLHSFLDTDCGRLFIKPFPKVFIGDQPPQQTLDPSLTHLRFSTPGRLRHPKSNREHDKANNHCVARTRVIVR